MLTYDPDQEEQQRKFSVYVHYLAAIAGVIQESFRSTREMARAISSTRQFQQLRVNRSYDDVALEKFLRNAWFTEIQARIPRGMPDVIPYANHWLAVQVYYSLYLAMRALFVVALDRRVVESHEAALRTFAAEVGSRPGLFAVPWCMLAIGDPDVTMPNVKNCPKNDLQAVNPLTRPRGSDQWNLVALFLRTTRQRRLTNAIDAWKQKNKRKAIRNSERDSLVAALRPTTLMDALYRLRIRSNYEDADLYLTGGASDEDAKSYFEASSRILKSGLLNFELLIAKHIGRTRYDQIVNDFVRRERAGFSANTMQPRRKVIEEVLG